MKNAVTHEEIVTMLCNEYDANEEVISTLIEKNEESKRWIREMMEIDETGIMKFRLSSTIENKPLLQRFVLEMVDIYEEREIAASMIDLNFIKVKNKTIRITKAMSTTWGTIWNRFCNHDFNHIDREIFKNIGADPYQDNDPGSSYSQDVLHTMQCRWGEMAKNGRDGFLSVAFDDFMTLAGDACTFNSCLRIGGEYFSGAIEYLMSPNVMVAYSKEKGKDIKSGRTLVYLNKDLIATSRMYGTWYDSDSLYVRDIIQSKMGGDWIISGCASDWVTLDGYGYLDKGLGVATKRKGTSPEKIFIPQGICLQCGTTLDESEGTCSSCQVGTHCSECGERIRHENDEYWVNDSVFCESCYGELAAYCEKCEETGFKEDMYETNDGWVCKDCFNEYYTRCDHCNTIVHTRDTYAIEDGDEYVCEACYESYYGECSECNNNFRAYDLKEAGDGKTYCKDCYDKKFVECEICGAETEREDTEESGDYSYICQDCYDKEEKRKEAEEEEERERNREAFPNETQGVQQELKDIMETEVAEWTAC